MPVQMMPREKANRRFWNFRNAADGEAELLLYSEIADTTWFGDEVTPLQFVADLRAATATAAKITVRINSGGGDVFAANAIASNLRDVSEQGKTVICKIDGVCASAATIVAMAADKILIPSGGYMMIHNAATGLLGYYTADELLAMADTLETITDGIVNTYMARTGLDAKACEKLMDATTWMTGKEAVEKGFADELTDDPVNVRAIDDEDVIVNGVKFKFAASANLPADLRKRAEDKSKGGTELDVKDVNALRAAYPDFVDEIESAAREAGAQAERERLKAIDDLPGIDPAYLAEAKYGAEALSPGMVALNALKNGKLLKADPLAALATDRQSVNAVSGALEVTTTDAEKQKLAEESRKKNLEAYHNELGLGGRNRT